MAAIFSALNEKAEATASARLAECDGGGRG